MEEVKTDKVSMGMFLVTIGIVYGDIGTSPMYVMKSIIEGNGGLSRVDPDFITGALSLVIWTITLLTTIKHVLIALRADNHGEGGIFALYSLVRNCGRCLPQLLFFRMKTRAQYVSYICPSSAATSGTPVGFGAVAMKMLCATAPCAQATTPRRWHGRCGRSPAASTSACSQLS